MVNDEIRIKSSTITKVIIGVLVLIILVLTYFVVTNHGTNSTTQSAALSSANQTIASQDTRINSLQVNVSSLQSENTNLKTQLRSDNNTIASLSASLNNTKYSTATCTPSISSAVVATSLNTAVTPLVIFDSQANSASSLISVGNGTEAGGYGNLISQQIEKEYGVSPTPNSNIVQAYGNNRILIAGYYASGTVQAGNQFVQDLLSTAQSNTGSFAGISFGNIPIINSAGQPVIQIVIGSDSLPSDGVVAANIAAAIGSLAHTYSNVTCTVSH